MTDVHIIRTSDRGTFRRCRQMWDFGSKIRMNYKPVRTAKPLEFGIAVHSGLEVYYDPTLWDKPREVAEGLMIAEFVKTNEEHKQTYRKALQERGTELSEEDIEEYESRKELGVGMLKHYAKWAPTFDKDFQPVYSEIEFEVPITVPHGWPLPQGFEAEPYKGLDRVLHYQGLPVVYQGRLDLVFEDEFGNNWVMDHKTAQDLRDNDHYAIDPQVGSYCWALWMLGVDVSGFIINELRKATAEKPAILSSPRKGRMLSINKQQGTTYALYLEAIQELNEPIELYEDMLQFLKAQEKGPDGNGFFRRSQFSRSAREIEIIGHQILEEAIDMLNEPYIYPNPSRWNCYNCPFKTPCMAKQEGSDPLYVLNNLGLYEPNNGDLGSAATA